MSEVAAIVDDQLDDLLKVLVCPKSKGDLEVVDLPSAVCETLVERYREPLQGEEPVVKQGLLCQESGLVYPIVSSIPIMLIDDALAVSDLEQTQ